MPRRSIGRSEEEAEGEGETYPEFDVKERSIDGTMQEVRVLRERKRALARAGTAYAGEGPTRLVTQPIGNLQLALVPGSDLAQDAPYRWDRDQKGDHVLRINVNHPLHRAVATDIGSEGHRLYLATLAALALAERRWSVVGRQGIASFILEVAEDVLGDS